MIDYDLLKKYRNAMSKAPDKDSSIEDTLNGDTEELSSEENKAFNKVKDDNYKDMIDTNIDENKDVDSGFVASAKDSIETTPKPISSEEPSDIENLLDGKLSYLSKEDKKSPSKDEEPTEEEGSENTEELNTKNIQEEILRDKYKRYLDVKNAKPNHIGNLLGALGSLGAVRARDLGRQVTDYENIYSDAYKDKKVKELQDDLLKENDPNFSYHSTAEGIVRVNKKTGETNLAYASDAAKDNKEASDKNYELKKERLKLSKELGYGALAFKKIQFSNKLEEQEELKPAQQERVATYNSFLSNLNDIKDLYINNPSLKKYLGYISENKIQNAETYLPILQKDPDYIKLKQRIDLAVNKQLADQSGKTVTKDEWEKFLQGMATLDAKPEEFEVKLNTILEHTADNKIEYLNTLGIEKKGAEKYKDSPSKNYKDADSNSKKEEFIRVISPNKVIGRWPKSKPLAPGYKVFKE